MGKESAVIFAICFTRLLARGNPEILGVILLAHYRQNTCIHLYHSRHLVRRFSCTLDQKKVIQAMCHICSLCSSA